MRLPEPLILPDYEPDIIDTRFRLFLVGRFDEVRAAYSVTGNRFPMRLRRGGALYEVALQAALSAFPKQLPVGMPFREIALEPNGEPSRKDDGAWIRVQGDR